MKTTISRFRQYLVANRCSPNTVQSYVHTCIQFNEFTGKEFGQATPQEFLDFSDHLTNEQKVKPSTYHVKLMGIKKLIKFHEHMNLPCQIPYDMVKSAPVPVQQNFGITDKEYEQLLKFVERRKFQDARNRAMVLLLGTTGLRVSEATNLEVSHINPSGAARPEIDDIPCTLDVLGKGNKLRMVILGDSARKALLIYLKERLKMEGADLSEAFFVSNYKPGAAAISRESFSTMISNRAKKVGIKTPVTAHTLRHYFGGKLLNTEGITIIDVKDVMGHSSVVTTQRYVQPTKTELFAKFSNALNKGKKKLAIA